MWFQKVNGAILKQVVYKLLQVRSCILFGNILFSSPFYSTHNLRRISVFFSSLIEITINFLVFKDSVKETTDCTDDSGIIINIIIATTVAGVFLSIIIIVLLVKYKRLKRALRLSTHVDIPLEAVETPYESLPIDQVSHLRIVKFELVELSSISKVS